MIIYESIETYDRVFLTLDILSIDTMIRVVQRKPSFLDDKSSIFFPEGS